MCKDNYNYRDFINETEDFCCRSSCNPCRPKPDPCCIGPEGPRGPQGPPGRDGRSAYQVALDNGFIGTESEWLESLRGEPGPTGPTGPTGSLLSSYVEAVGNTQEVGSRENIAFNINEDYLDIVGNDIEINELGTIFTINRAGLYHLEWSVNLESGTPPTLICLLENGLPSSALSNIVSSGNYTSGGLINVTEDELPYTISLHNFGAPIELGEPTGFEGTAASIRILRFADGPTV